jgi:hypothetical protein
MLHIARYPRAQDGIGCRKAQLDGLQLRWFHMNMSAAFDTGGEEGGGACVSVWYSMPVDTEVWVGSCKVLSPALGRGEVLLKSTQCLVFETLQLVLYEQTTTVIANTKLQTRNVLHVSSENVRKVVVRSTRANGL